VQILCNWDGLTRGKFSLKAVRKILLFLYLYKEIYSGHKAEISQKYEEPNGYMRQNSDSENQYSKALTEGVQL